MKYIIMCGGQYNSWEMPRQLSVVKGEELVGRTIRLLKENGIKDIAISSNNPIFEKFGIPILKHDNKFVVDKNGKGIEGNWFNGFYPLEEPACYIFGDVYFSEYAIKTIVETEVDDIELFGSKPPYDERYIKTHEEPFALKVVNQKHLREAIEKSRELDKQHKFWRQPIVWELFTVIKNAPLQTKKNCYTTDYVGISDYTCDIDKPIDALRLNIRLGGDMIKLQATEDFSLNKKDKYEVFYFDKLQNLKRFDKKGKNQIYKNDEFECDKEIADYLCGNNPLNRVVVKILEIEEPKKEEVKVEIKEELQPIEEKEINKKKKTKKSKK